MAVNDHQFHELEKRVGTTEQDLHQLALKVAEFVGATKGAQKVLMVIVALSQLAQVLLQFLHGSK